MCGAPKNKKQKCKIQEEKSMMKVFCTETTKEFVKADAKKTCILKSKRGRNAETIKTKLVVDKKLNFFLQANNKIYFLFAQSYNEDLFKAFRNGVSIDKAIDFSMAKRNKSILRVMDKLPSHIRYIEQEYGIEIFRKSSKKRGHSRTNAGAFSFEDNVACGA